MRRRRPDSVWIVQHDESPDDTVLGVFASPEEAHEYAQLVQGEFENSVIITEFEIGYRHRDGAVRYTR